MKYICEEILFLKWPQLKLEFPLFSPPHLFKVRINYHIKRACFALNGQVSQGSDQFSLLHGASKSFLLIVNSVEAKGIGSLCSKLPCGQRNPHFSQERKLDQSTLWIGKMCGVRLSFPVKENGIGSSLCGESKRMARD